MEVVSTRGFKRKTIVNTIQLKMRDYLRSVSDKELAKEIANHYVVTGGAITSMLLGQLPNDFDIYFDNVDTAKKVADYYLDKINKGQNSRVGEIEAQRCGETRVSIMIKSAGVASETTDLDRYRYFEGTNNAEMYFDKNFRKTEKKYGVILINSNAITLNDNVQLIMRFVGPPAEIHKNYDFVHCTNYYSPSTGLVLNQPALESTLAKELKYVGSLYPVCSMFRLKKFIRRGWTITAGEMLKIAYDIAELDLSRADVLQEQLIGVDAAYFQEALAILQKEGKDLDRTYLFEVINRVFDEPDEDFELLADSLDDDDDQNDDRSQLI